MNSNYTNKLYKIFGMEDDQEGALEALLIAFGGVVISVVGIIIIMSILILIATIIFN